MEFRGGSWRASQTARSTLSRDLKAASILAPVVVGAVLGRVPQVDRLAPTHADLVLVFSRHLERLALVLIAHPAAPATGEADKRLESVRRACAECLARSNHIRRVRSVASGPAWLGSGVWHFQPWHTSGDENRPGTPTALVPASNVERHGGSVSFAYPNRSMMVALAMPPPSHIGCSHIRYFEVS